MKRGEPLSHNPEREAPGGSALDGGPVYTRMQATQWFGDTSRNGGTSPLHSSMAMGQRVWNTHPEGG